MSAAPPQLILFDLGNVLLKFDHEIACQKIAEASGVSIDAVRDAVFKSGLQWRFEEGEINGQEFYDLFCRATGGKVEYAALCTAASDIFEINIEVVPIVAQLRAAGYRLGILSNTCEAHWRFVTDGRYAILPSYFDIIALSYQLKAMKPKVRAYQATAELAQTPPEKIFYLDDRPENVAGAIAAGFDAVLFTTASSLVKDLRQRGVRFNY